VRAAVLQGLSPELVNEISDGVEGKGEQVEGGEGGSKMLLAMAEIVLEAVAFCGLTRTFGSA
jgi:hypothetical protein